MLNEGIEIFPEITSKPRKIFYNPQFDFSGAGIFYFPGSKIGDRRCYLCLTSNGDYLVNLWCAKRHATESTHYSKSFYIEKIAFLCLRPVTLRTFRRFSGGVFENS